jgi:hypothetical protein
MKDAATNNLLSRGNGKLGEGIYTFSLPALITCPGRSRVCVSDCYALKHRFKSSVVQKVYMARYVQSLADDFSARMIDEIKRRGCAVVRIHVSGDFYDAEYTAKWTEIARRCPRTTFFVYTRSWRVQPIVPSLVAFSRLKNVKLWFSCDRETGMPGIVPKRVRIAYMQVTSRDRPEGHLTFRVHKLRKLPVVHGSLPVICPVETPQGATSDVTCTSCRKCFR